MIQQALLVVLTVCCRPWQDNCLRMSCPRKRVSMLLLPLVSLLWVQGVVADVVSDIDAIIDSPKTPAALWGARIEDSKTGKVLYSRNGDSPFVPASVAKLITTAVALDQLGPDYTFTTHLQFPHKTIPQNGIIRGDIHIIGGGDPTLGTAEGAVGRNFLKSWAKRMVKDGVKRIEGDVIGDDDIFVDEPLGRGWAWDDENYAFSAQPSGLTIHGGTVGYRIDKNRKQGLKKEQVHLYPDTDYMQVEVKRSGKKRQVQIGRTHGTNNFVVEIPKKMRRNPEMSGKVTVDNPTAYTATLFKEVLKSVGIKVDGSAVDRDQSTKAVKNSGLVWTHHSKPLRDILPLANKRSINLVAEHLLRATGVKRNKSGEIVKFGSVERGLQKIDRFMGKRKIKSYRYSLVDGSGLSRYNLLRPADLVKILRFMDQHPQGKVFRKALSRAGHDGTLRYRFHDTALQGRVWGKTGTLSSVRGIAGYLKTKKGKELTFSVLVNNYASGSRNIRNRIDQILLKAAHWADK